MDIVGLYGKLANSKEKEKRLSDLEQEHLKIFGAKAQATFSTSGRTELGGNHTDHNLGKVLAGSIDMDTIAAVHTTGDNRVIFVSQGFPSLDVDLSDLSVDERLFGSTAALIRGVAAAMVARGGKVGGFCANVSSAVFQGSGLSSSAAVEVLIGTIFNDFFNYGRFSTTDISIMSQQAENLYFGKPSGLMDQIACANGGIVGIDFENPTTPKITPVSIDFSDFGYNLVITTTGGSHADLTADYASIPAEMKSVAAFFGATALRSVQPSSFLDNINDVRAFVKNDRAILRAFHYFEENQRVTAMLSALNARDFDKYLSLVNESGQSSFMYLQNIYSPQSSAEQGISLAYMMAKLFLKNRGAFRVQGGGFAGTIQAYVPIDMTHAYFTHMERLFGPNCCTTLSIRNLPTMRVR